MSAAQTLLQHHSSLRAGGRFEYNSVEKTKRALPLANPDVKKDDLAPVRAALRLHDITRPPSSLFILNLDPVKPAITRNLLPNNRRPQPPRRRAMASTVAIGIGVAAAAFFGRAGLVALRRYRDPSAFNALGRPFYKGGFENKMTKREASLILEMKESAISKEKLRKRHREMMLLNHPDRGGSPYLAGKVNEAKELLERGG